MSTNMYPFIDAIISRSLTGDKDLGADILKIVLASFALEGDKRTAADVCCRLITLGVDFKVSYTQDGLVRVYRDGR